MDPKQLIELAERVEKAEASQQREMLERAAAVLAIHRLWPDSDDRAARFYALLNAEAYESAALMLVPEGAFWWVGMRGENRGGFHACCQIEGDLDWREGATPALALTAAALRAHASMEQS